jgi:hypothetical protein
MKKILISALIALAILFSIAWLYGHIAEPIPSVFKSVEQYQIPSIPTMSKVNKENVSLKESFESAHKHTE